MSQKFTPSAHLIDWLTDVLSAHLGFDFKVHLTLNFDQQRFTITHKQDEAKALYMPMIKDLWITGDARALPCSHLTYNNKNLPAPGLTHNTMGLLAQKDDQTYFQYDLMGLITFMLLRLEEMEVNEDRLDEHDRFSAKESHAHAHSYLTRPLVDEWIATFIDVMKNIWPDLPYKKRTFKMILSHDVDAPSQYGLKSWYQILCISAADFIKRGRLKTCFIAPWQKLNTNDKIYKNDIFNTFDNIMNLSEKHDLTSHFYFICGQTDKKKDGDYTLDQAPIKNLMQDIHQRGHMIGIHPSYNTYQDQNAFNKEVQNLRDTLKKYAITQDYMGGRMHYLRFKMPDTLRLWRDAGLSYDTSLSYADNAGFRCGTSIPYRFFDIEQDQSSDLIIKPLIAMEVSITKEKYQNLGNGERAFQALLSLKKACEEVGGDFTLLWHNSNLTTDADFALYQRIIEA